MPAFNFKKQFIPFIESGEKTHTIRAKRGNRPQVGQAFYAYFGMRTRQCRKIMESTITKVEDITIELVQGGLHERNYRRITIDGQVLAPDEMEALARRDGFANLSAMMEFWPVDRLPFRGDVIHWKSAESSTACNHFSGVSGLCEGRFRCENACGARMRSGE